MSQTIIKFSKLKTDNSKVYFSYLDILKGIAISMVVIGHVLLFTFDIKTGMATSFIYFNMPLFFYISGYLAYRKINRFRECADRVLKRGMVLLIPYIMFLTFWLLYSGEQITFSLYISFGTCYWFLYVLFLISSFFTLYEYHIHKVTNWILYVILWIIPFAILVVLKIKFNDFDGIQIITNYYRWYLIGYLCRKYILLHRLLFENNVSYAIGFLMYIFNWIFFEFHNIALIFLGTLGALITLQSTVQRINPNSHINQILIYLGKGSLGIYVIHYFFIPMGNLCFISIPNDSSFISQFTISALIAIPIISLSVFFYKIIDHNRYLSLALFGKLNQI